MTDSAEPDGTPGGNDAPTYKYDIAVSFAGEQRSFVEEVVRGLGLPKDRVFYDADYKAELLGEDLAEVFTNLYRDETRYVAMFISREYADKEWCRVERRAALRKRMMVKGAYILPIRLDTTKLDEVEGLLGTIGDLDGLREGVAGVAEVLRAKLEIAFAAEGSVAADVDEDGAPEFATIQVTQEGLVTLLQERPHAWPWAAFASVLVQRKEAMKIARQDHQLGFAHPNGLRIDTYAELHTIVKNTLFDAEQVGERLRGFLENDAFASVFGERFEEETADPDGIVHAATRLMDFYDRYLQLAERIRGASARADYVNAIDTCARIVDEPLSGMDDFIDEYVAMVEAMPARLLAANGENFEEPIGIRLHVDSELAMEVLRQLKDLKAAEEG
jgi:hypothetical protein